MTNVFKDQETFMVAGDQTVDRYNQQQFDLYVNLIEEELAELKEAITDDNDVEKLDALIDIMVVTIGAIHSMGADGQGAWDEVTRSNFSKVDKVTGKVIKRADGKIMKPESYFPPKLSQYVTK